MAGSALLVMLPTACQATIPLGLGDSTPRIVISAIATAQQGIDVSLSQSKPTGTASPRVEVNYNYDRPGCPYRMTLQVNGQLVPVSEVEQYKSQAGDRVAISVEKAGLKTTSVTTTVPAQFAVGVIVAKKLDKTHHMPYTYSMPGRIDIPDSRYVEVRDYELSIPLQGVTKDGYYRIVVEEQIVGPEREFQESPYAWSQEEIDDPRTMQSDNGDLISESSRGRVINLLASSNVSASDCTLRTTLSFATKVHKTDGSTDDGRAARGMPECVALRVTVYAITDDLYRYWQTVTAKRYSSLGNTDIPESNLIYNNIRDGLSVLGNMAMSLRQDLKIITR